MNYLHCLGIGIVSENKNTDTDTIQVSLPKDFPSQEGENVADASEVVASYNTQDGEIIQNKVLLGNTVPARWMSLNSNRITAPDVREGTRVALYQYANTNRYLWTLDGFDGTMRLETVIYAWSASPNINENTPITPDNYYILSISTHTGKIELLTGQGNSEACGFQFTLNTKEGYFGIMDSFGQIFMNNAMESSLTYVNKEKTQFSINKKDFTLLNEGNTLFNTKESINMKSKQFTLVVDEEFLVKAKSGRFEFEEECSIKAGSLFTVNSPNSVFSEKISVGQQLVSPSIMANGVEFVNHMHGGVRKGEDFTLGAINERKEKTLTIRSIQDVDKNPLII